MAEPKGTIIFSTVGRTEYAFDIFSLSLLPYHHHHFTPDSERRLTDATSINFNGHFVDDDQTLVFVSERSGSPRVYLTRTGLTEPEPIVSVPGSLFHDRPVVKDSRAYFVAANEPEYPPLKSWPAVYAARVGSEEDVTRVSPEGCVDYSPAVSESGKFMAVASSGSGSWGGDFRELKTEIIVFPLEDPKRRSVVVECGGWPTFSGDFTVFFHCVAEDGWWSIYRADLLEDPETTSVKAIRVTPPGVHAFTPAAFHGGERKIAVATRRKGSKYRHVEIFDLETEKFYPVTEILNPNVHHYNPFVSPRNKFLGYHRFRSNDARVQNLEPVASPIKNLRLLRINGFFPCFSPDGDFIAYNPSLDPVSGGLKIVQSDGSKRWTLIKGRTAFYNSWSSDNAIFTSLGPIFESPETTVQIARITFKFSTVNGGDIDVDVKILTRDDTGNNAFPACSPDGKSVVFRSGRSGYKNLYIIDAVNGEFEGGSIRKLTEGAWIDTMPSWSPDGKLIAFSSNRHNPKNPEIFGIYVVQPDGMGLRRVHMAGRVGSSEAERERINHVEFSPDGEWLLFTANIGGVTAEPVAAPNQFQPYGDLYIVRLDGRGLQRLTCNGYENGTPTWHSKDIGRVAGVQEDEYCDELLGQFDEPLWINFDH